MKPKASRLLPALALLGLALPVQAAPGLWEVKDDDSSIFLFGSFHVLAPGTQWRTDLFDKLVDEADKVVFETDVRAPAMAKVGADAYVRGVYVDGTLLTDVLGPELEARLRTTAESIMLPMGSIQAMKPWMATNLITVQAMAMSGYQEQGVEFVVQPELADDRMEWLETGDEQLDVLAGAPEDEQIAMLGATLDELPKMPKILDKMIRSWANGTPDRMIELFQMEMGGFETAFLDRLLYQRNRNWIPPLETMLAENQKNMIIVGAAHLIGQDNVLQLLEDAGYTVERIQ